MSHATVRTLDLAKILRAGDRILVPSGAAEPLPLTRLLVEQRQAVGPVDVLLGYTMSPTFLPDHLAPLSVTVLGGYGNNKDLTGHEGVEILPCHVSSLPRLIESGTIRVDVALIQCSPADAHGHHSLGVTSDLVLGALRRARVVIAEINDQMPRTFGDTQVPAEWIHHQVHTSRPLTEMTGSTSVPATDLTIAEAIAGLVPDQAVLQVGIGRLPTAAAQMLHGHKDLGIHSGLVGDWAVELIESGAVTNACKPIDRGVTVSGMLMGSRKLYEWAHENRALSMRSADYTHGQAVLDRLHRFVSINSAIEVDLSGQVNAEVIGDHYVGAVGGQVDYIRAGSRSSSGRSIVALNSTASRGARSRIVPRLPEATVTSLRTDVDVVVTEHGVAELQGLTLSQRAERLCAIADPSFREELARAARSGPGSSATGS